MFGGGPSGEEQQDVKRMANAQVISSLVQFGIAVGLMNLGESREKNE